MNTRKIRSAFFAVIVVAMASLGVVACDTGTKPGDTNVERSDHHDEGSMVGGETGDEAQAARDTMEQPYERTKEGSAVHAGDGKQDAPGRGEKKQ